MPADREGAVVNITLPPAQPLTPQRVLNLVGGAIVGVAFFIFFLVFLGLTP